MDRSKCGNAAAPGRARARPTAKLVALPGWRSAGRARTWDGMRLWVEQRLAPDAPAREKVYRNFRANLAAMQGILGECFARASQRQPKQAEQAKQAALRDAFSCYYSGNFVTGHQHGYVGKVLAAWNSRPVPPGGTAGIAFPQAGLSPARFTSTHPGVSQ